MAKLFLPQTQLEEWAISEQADVREDKLLVKGESAPYAVTQAVHFKAVASGEDTQQLVSKVKTQAQLQALGAEEMMGSVLLGETAYDVEAGYLVTVPDAELPRTQSDADLLAAFLMNKS